MIAKVTINCDNAAFEPNLGFELSYILRTLADEVHWAAIAPGFTKSLRDSNGNRVGQLEVVDGEES